MNKYFISIIGILAVTGLFFGIKLTTQKPSDNRAVLRVGMFCWAPFMTINPQGQYEGFDVDVARALANKLGKKLEIIDLGSLAPLFIALEQRKIDCIFSGLDITQERLNKFIMVPYFGSGFSSFKLLFWKEIPANIKTITDLAQLEKPVIAVEPGSASEKFLNQFNFIEQKPLASVPDMLMDVKYGRSTAAILEPLITKRVMQQMPELKALDIPISEEFRVYGIGMALRKEQKELAQELQQAIAQLQQEKAIKQFAQNWNLDDGEKGGSNVE